MTVRRGVRLQLKHCSVLGRSNLKNEPIRNSIRNLCPLPELTFGVLNGLGWEFLLNTLKVVSLCLILLLWNMIVIDV